MTGILIAIVSGALMSIQGVFNTGLTKQTSVWMAAAYVQLSAFIICLLAWFLTGRGGTLGALFGIENKYMLLGGVLGALITITVIKSMSNLGPAKAVLLIVVAQLLVAYLIELFGLFGTEKAPFVWQKFAGLLLSAGGIVLFSLY